MALTLKDYQSNLFTGLGTFTYNVTVAGLYFASCTSSELPPSGLSIVINQNGSPVVSSATVQPAQMIVSAQTQISCAVNDVITFVLSSSNANDLSANTIKSTIVITLQN
jgi:hypothetical protein